jgi:hypothetical protein
MKRIAIVLAVLVLLCLPVVVAAECPAPKIYVTPTVLKGEMITPAQAAEFNTIFSRELREANPGVVVTSAQDIGAMLAHEQQAIESGEQASFSDSIAQKTRAEYITSLQVGNVGSRYVVTSSLTDADLGIVVARASSEVGSIDAIPGALGAQVEGMGDLASLIRTHETSHPVPPRAPSLSVTVDPKTVTSEDIRDTTTMSVTVTNCRGEPVKGTKVYFESRPARGWVKGEGESTDPGWYGWQYAVTDASGTARATFTLDPSRGTGAGHTSVQIGTDGRGGADARIKADISIIGMMLTAAPADPEIAPRGQTDITVTLFEVGENQERRPLEGRSLYVEKFRISSDARVVVSGPTDGDGNPVTDANGEVLLKFIAGEKEGVERLRILFQDVGTGYAEAIDTWAEIVVKKDEYVATANWHESGSLDYEYSWQYDLYQWDYEYDLTLFTKTQKEKNTGQEVTDGTFRYTDTLDYYTEGRTVFDTPFSTGYSIVPFEEQWDVSADVKGRINNHQSINTALEERLSTLAIPVTPFPVPFDVSGGTDYEVLIVYKVGGNEITANGDGRVANTESIRMMGRAPQTGIMGDTIASVNEEVPDFHVIRTLKHMSGALDKEMGAMKDSKLTELLTQAGKNVYAKRWSVHESNSYHADLFTWLGSTARMDIDSEFTRDVTLGAVKQ